MILCHGLRIVWHSAGAALQRIEETTGAGWWDRLQAGLRETCGPPLKALQEPIDIWLSSLPMSVAVGCAVGLYVIALVWTWLMPREFIYRGAPDQSGWRDLRIWATFVLIPYIGVYLWLGR